MLAPKLFLNTFGGNPVCCAGGRAVLRVIDQEGIQANCAKVPKTSAFLDFVTDNTVRVQPALAVKLQSLDWAKDTAVVNLSMHSSLPKT